MTPTPRGNITWQDPEWSRFDDCAIVGVVGTDHYQPALEAATKPPPRGSFRYECLATLLPEPDNRHDKFAVKVMIGGHHVGYLKRGTAKRKHRKLAEMREDGEPTDYTGFVRRDVWEETDSGPLQMTLRIPRDGRLYNPITKR